MLLLKLIPKLNHFNSCSPIEIHFNFEFLSLVKK